MVKVGVLALQGAFREHAEVFDALGAETCLVKRPDQLAGIDAIALPGGESTTQTKLLATSGLKDPLIQAMRDGLGCFATCAGMILLAAELHDARADQQPLALLDISVQRNGYGRQVLSFEAEIDIDGMPEGFTGIFIRAPRVTRVGNSVEVLASLGSDPVLVRCGNIWAAGFHPELSNDLRLHQLFLNQLATTEGV